MHKKKMLFATFLLILSVIGAYVGFKIYRERGERVYLKRALSQSTNYLIGE